MNAIAEIEHDMLAQPVDRIEVVEAKLLHLPQRECPVVHKFAPGVYMREILMPRNTFVIGHQHKTKHFNIVLTGRAIVMMDGVVNHVTAPCTFVSEPGVRKVLYIIEPMRWATCHVTESTDLTEIEEQVIEKSPTYKAHMEDMKKLKELMASGEVKP